MKLQARFICPSSQEKGKKRERERHILSAAETDIFATQQESFKFILFSLCHSDFRQLKPFYFPLHNDVVL